MFRSFSLPVSMALVIAALLSATAPALADEAPAAPLAVTEPSANEAALQVTEPGELAGSSTAPAAPDGHHTAPTADDPILPGEESDTPPIGTGSEDPTTRAPGERDGAAHARAGDSGTSSGPEAGAGGEAGRAPGEGGAAGVAQSLATDQVPSLMPPVLEDARVYGTTLELSWNYAEGDDLLEGSVVATLWSAQVGGVLLREITSPVSATSSRTSHTWHDLPPNTEIWIDFRRGIPNGSLSAASPRHRIKTGTPIPAPTNVTAVLDGNDLRVSWAQVPDPAYGPIDMYRLHLDIKDPGPGGYEIPRVAGDATSMVVPLADFRFNLAHGRQVRVAVIASTSKAMSAPSEFVDLGVLPQLAERPTFGPAVPTADGFTAELLAFDPEATYTALADYGSAKVEGKKVTVTGLEPGQRARATVTLTKPGHFRASSTVAGEAERRTVAPMFDSPVPITDGFTVNITNFDAQLTYNLKAQPDDPSLSITRAGSSVTVRRLPAGETATLLVTAARAGWLPGTGSVAGTALRLPSSTPHVTLRAVDSDGFVAVVTNYDPKRTYSVHVPGAPRATLVGDTLDVRGMGANRSARVRITSTLPGEREAVAYFDVTTEKNAAVPFEVVDVVSTADGWTARIGDYENLADGATGFNAVTTAGEVTVRDGVVTVSGLAPNASARVTVTLDRRDTAPSTAEAEGRALQWYKASFDAFGGQPAMNTADAVHGTRLMAPEPPTRDRYAFTGWFTDQELQDPYDFDAPVTSDLALYAGWEISAYAVTWDENHEGAGTPDTVLTTGKMVGSLPAPSANGKVIREWNTSANGSGTAVNEDTLLSSVASGTEVTLHAIWEKRTLMIEPSTTAPVSGAAFDITATANAPFGGTVDVTADVALESSDPADTVTGPTVLAAAAGPRTITGTFDGATATARVEVAAGPVAGLTLTPSATTVDRGGMLTFTVTGIDAANNPVEIDPAHVTLSSDVETDVVDGLTVMFPTASPHVITAAVGDVTESVTIDVLESGVAPPTESSHPDPLGAAPSPPHANDVPGQLVATGSAPIVGAAGALLLLVVGAGLLVRGRRTEPTQ